MSRSPETVDAEWVQMVRNPRSQLHKLHPEYVMESDREKIAAAIGVKKQSIVLQTHPKLKKLMLKTFSMKAVDGGGARLAKNGKYFLFSVPQDPQDDRSNWTIDEDASKQNIRVELERFVIGKRFNYKDGLIVAFLAVYCANPSFVCDLVDNEFDSLMNAPAPNQSNLGAVTNPPEASAGPEPVATAFRSTARQENRVVGTPWTKLLKSTTFWLMAF